jgi:hypothetical protein
MFHVSIFLFYHDSPIVGLARTSHVNYPDIRPSGSLRRNGKLEGEEDGSK